MPLPALDPDQRRAALAKAAEARRIRAELKQMLKSGEVSLGDVLDRATSAEALAKMRVAEVLEAMPAYGPVKARKLMDHLEQRGVASMRVLVRDALDGRPVAGALVTLFDRAASRLAVAAQPEPLDLDHLMVREAAASLGISIS